MTQAEILEKYGLLTQAVDQLYEVVERYPGHLEANQRLVTLQRGSAEDSVLAQALVKLGLARRAAGRVDVARQSVAEADKLGGVDASMRGILVALDLLDGEPVAAVPEPAAAPKAAPVAASTPAREVTPAETVIDFDSFDDEGDEEADDAAVDAAIDAVAESATPAVVAETVPPAEDETSAAPGTAEPVVSSVPKFDETPAVLARGTDDAMRFEPLPALDQDQDDADLAALAAALDEDLLGEDSLDEAPASESEESLDEVFAAFRERVDEEVGAQDYRTHYDLGIGYKEMGLLDAAIAEFEISVKGQDLVQESCVMLALCFRERAEHVRAAEWYRQAVDALGQDPADTCGLRYDLAETLLDAGDTQAAADLFRDVERLDPGFRDVTRRLADLTPAGSD
jgi:tetratricopeptide (TPR) repeat protein